MIHDKTTDMAMDDSGRDVVIQRAAARLRETGPTDSAFDQRVMAAVRAAALAGNPPRAKDTRLGRFWGPGAALAAAAVVAVVGLTHARVTPASLASATQSGRHMISSPAAAPKGVSAGTRHSATWVVRFTFVPPAASPVVDHINIAGSFNGWDTSATPLRPGGHGTWITDVPLHPGRYVYQFIINGKQWVPDPAAPRDPGSDFGTANSVVTVTAGGIT